MFADSFYETPWANRSRRGWTTLASFAVQAAGLALLLILPLIYTGALPQLQRTEVIKMPAAQLEPPPPPMPLARHSPGAVSNMIGNHLQLPQRIPTVIQNVVESVRPPQIDSSATPWRPGDRMSGNSPVGDLARGFPTAPLPPPPPVARTVRISHMSEGNLIHRVQPDYPAIAKAAGIQGAVVLQAVIGHDGGIERLQAVSGHPMLVPAAMRAVAQWRYRPYLLNGEPVEVETQITVNFLLAGR